MSSREVLLTIAEIAIAVIGFAGIVSALRPRGSEAADAMHRLRLRLMVEASGVVMVFAFLPFLIGAELDGPELWAVASAILAVAAPIQVASIYIRQRRLFGTTLMRETLWFDSATIATAVLVEGVLVGNATALFFEPRFSGYLLGVLFPLGTSVAMFVRAIFASADLAPQERGGLDG